jgi:hypothetical protein
MPGVYSLLTPALDLTKMNKLTSLCDALTDLSWLAFLHQMFK